MYLNPTLSSSIPKREEAAWASPLKEGMGERGRTTLRVIPEGWWRSLRSIIVVVAILGSRLLLSQQEKEWERGERRGGGE